MESAAVSGYGGAVYGKSAMKMRSYAPMSEMMAASDSASGGAMPPPVDESYSIANSEISYAQSERLVQKALNRK
jgi:hypothetical protein